MVPSRTCLAVLLVITATTALGCRGVQGYPGPQRPLDEVAQLRVNPTVAPIGFLVESVDDTPQQAQVLLELLPGHHALGLRVTPTAMADYWLMSPAQATESLAYDRQHAQHVVFTVDVEAGRTYGLDGRWNDGVYDCWLLDLDTGDRVARPGP